MQTRKGSDARACYRVHNNFIDGEEVVEFNDLEEARDFASDTGGCLVMPDGTMESYEAL